MTVAGKASIEMQAKLDTHKAVLSYEVATKLVEALNLPNYTKRLTIDIDWGKGRAVPMATATAEFYVTDEQGKLILEAIKETPCPPSN